MKPLASLMMVCPGVGFRSFKNWLLGVCPVAGMTRSVCILRPLFSSSSKLDPSVGKPFEGKTARVPVMTLQTQLTVHFSS